MNLRERCLGWIQDTVGWGVFGLVVLLVAQSAFLALVDLVRSFLSYDQRSAEDGWALFGSLFCVFFSLPWSIPVWFWLRTHRPKAALGWAIALCTLLLAQGACTAYVLGNLN